MKFNLPKALLFLFILCLGTASNDIVFAEEAQSETYGAYPGAPTPASAPVRQSEPIISPQVGQTTTLQAGQISQSSGAASPGTITAVYTNQAPPADQQKVLLSYDVQTAPPAAVYYSGTFMTWPSFYQLFPRKSPALWVASSAGWSWYATCPVGGWIQNLMYVPYTGTMKLYEFYPDGSIKLYSYGFATPGYKYIWFYADTPGRHLTLFTIFDKPSNYITIDVF